MRSAIGRLTRRPEFLRVANGRRKWVVPGLILQALPRKPGGTGPNDADAIRVGFTVSRKVGKAVERNRVRRRLRAAAAEVMPEFGRPGYDYVLIGRTATLTRRYGELVADLRTAMHRLGASRTQAEGEERDALGRRTGRATK